MSIYDGDGMGQRRLTEALVDLSAIAHNTRVLHEHSNGRLMAVVKGDGFGHGAVPVARAALANGASWLGVAHISEALALRAAGLTAPTFAWMHPSDDDVTEALRADVDLSASSAAHLAGIAACAERARIPAVVHLKVDTGLHRNGASMAEWPALAQAAAQLVEEGLIRVRGIWSHLAFSDDPTHPTTQRQVELFDTAVHQAEAVGLKAELLHLANSSAGLTVPRTRYDMVRAGVALYGVEPVPGQNFGLRPAMTLRTRVIAAHQVPAGEDMAFGHAYTAENPGTLVLLPLGYMQGLPRAASSAAQVWIDGARRPVAGLISMDHCVVDAGSARVAVGDEVVIFGSGEQGEPMAAEWALWANTNPQQTLTGLGLKVPRRYLPASEPHAPATQHAEHRSRVTVLFGGRGGEYDLSLTSAAGIVTHLDRDRYVVRPVRITPDGHWIPGPADLSEGHYGPQDLAQMTLDPDAAARGIGYQATDVLGAADVVVPALHGSSGGDGTVQALMDTLGVPYVGSGMAASALCGDADAAKRVVQTSGIPVAEWAVLRHDKEELSEDDRARLGLPVIVKPARSGSGVGVSRVADWGGLEAALAAARTWDTKVLIEQEVPGQQIEVTVLEHLDGSTRQLVPDHLDAQLTADLQRLAAQVFDALGCSGLARVGFVLRGGTEPVFHEINTIPGSTSSELLDLVIEKALAKKSS